MKGIVSLVVLAMLLAGCGVSVKKSVNWMPNDISNKSTFYDCLQQAQQVESRAGFVANQYGAGGSASTSAKTNHTLLKSCMDAKGYTLRHMNKVEVVTTIITLPLATVMVLLGDPIFEDFY